MNYIETFGDGPGGWYRWISNAAGPARLDIVDGYAVSRSPWWIDYNHAPPGGGYMHLLYMLNTGGTPGEHQRDTEGENRFILGSFPTNFTDAQLTLRLRGELKAKGARLHLLCQGAQDGLISGWLLTGQHFAVTSEWSEQSVSLPVDDSQWKCMGVRHDRQDYYGELPLETVLSDVNVDILLVLHPLEISPMGPIDGDPHLLRPEKDYPVWRSQLPEGYVHLDEVRIHFAGAPDMVLPVGP
ncbi:MAG: hypothetical protein VX733_10315 [Candidatus Latescibacterota bacterium]|nr:hypothetical protein [Candidatus Latescibacterota bacterium]